VGLYLSVKPSSERELILETLRSLTHLPLDVASAARGGLIFEEKTKEGAKIDPEDAMLAGIAVENAQVLLTRNTEHIAGIAGLRLETY